MDFIQTYQVDPNLCDILLGRLTVSDDLKTPSSLEVEIEELNPIMMDISAQFFSKIEEFNYFGLPGTQTYTIKNTLFNYIPPWNFIQWASMESGKYLNFYICLKDSKTYIEIFNPFIRKTVRFKCKQGLCIVFISTWLFVERFTNTFEGNSIFISGGIDVDDLDDKH